MDNDVVTTITMLILLLALLSIDVMIFKFIQMMGVIVHLQLFSINCLHHCVSFDSCGSSMIFRWSSMFFYT